MGGGVGVGGVTEKREVLNKELLSAMQCECSSRTVLKGTSPPPHERNEEKKRERDHVGRVALTLLKGKRPRR